MGAVAKNPIPQLVPPAAQPSPRLFIPDPARPPRTMSLKAAQQLSQFVPVIVMMPAAPVGDGGVPPAAAARNVSSVENAGAALLLQFLQNALSQVKDQKIENGLAFSDVKVSFSSMEATRKGRPVALTPLEFKTLKYLAQNARRVLSREELLHSPRIQDPEIPGAKRAARPFPRRTPQRSLGLRKLSLHPHRGQPHFEAAAKT